MATWGRNCWPAAAFEYNFTPIKDAQEILGRFATLTPMHAQWNRGNGPALKISDFLSPRAYKKEEYFGARRRGHHRLPDLLVRWMRCSKAQWDRVDERPDRAAPIVIDRGSRRLHVRVVPESLRRSMTHLRFPSYT